MITIVSGLPRSGTSLLMQMLKVGGIPVVTDDKRPADADNSKGYYEFEPVKKLEKYNSWLADAEGKSLKVISLLLRSLPDNYQYKVIFMTRNMSQILASQQAMLKNRNAENNSIDDAIMAKHFEAHIEITKKWLQEASNVDVIYINYEDLLSAPDESINMIINFLEIPLDIKAMISIITPSMNHHQ